jgi:DNA-directed RNA polymerase beta subunit
MNINDANKGIINMIMPDELCPVNLTTGEQIDCILGTLGIYSRISKTVPL